MELKDIFEAVTVQEPMSWRSVQVFPLLRPDGEPPAYALVDDLLESGQVKITEVGEGGAVPVITVRNDADVDALILDGSELRGAKQNRMVNVTVIVGRHSQAAIPVTCVEQGRWAYRSRHFTSAKRTVASKLRNLKGRMIFDQLDRRKTFDTDQYEVWRRVEDYLFRADSRSPTSALDDAFEERRPDIERFTEQLKGVDACGALVALNGRIIAVDLVDHARSFAKLWGMLLPGYAMDAGLEGDSAARPLTRSEVESWLRSVGRQAQLRRHEVPGVGEYYAVRAPEVAGGVVFHHGRAVHTVLFPADDAGRGAGSEVPAAEGGETSPQAATGGGSGRHRA